MDLFAEKFENTSYIRREKLRKGKFAKIVILNIRS